MALYDWMTGLIGVGAVVGQFFFAGTGLYMLLRLLPERPLRWKRLSFLKLRSSTAPDRWLRVFGIKRDHSDYADRELLLAGCGMTFDPAWYMLFRKLAMSVCLLIGTLAIVIFRGNLMYIWFQALVALPLLLVGALHLDRAWLRAAQKMRSLQFTKEIYVISNQLLYFSDSNLNIHAKLMRCMSYTKAMRGDMERLLAEWYHDPALALRQFKLRIGTDDGMSFVETIDAIRQHESSQYYELLRIRISDYKEKLELAKESRKESTSYGLFILAGIPILYTFQVFIYPWVREGQKLFQSLG
ncbi:hypothetical protein [Paenibacillus paeoniae]|uniref:Type II secretion system protein GspF domain-containing protein n=1 Tax=Paenibacillus paeoniae TaxID=2292705 RepID=A0A371P6I8_9BACL|nr:hypothetical protein [Paenibacillus paeoniae]REK71563.1 hypothetical protein DX130_21445 [Paenibacillus paeoniae]